MADTWNVPSYNPVPLSGGSSMWNNLKSFGSGLANFGKGVGGFMGSPSGQGLISLAGMGANLYGMDKTFGFMDDQMALMQEQENRAAKSQQLDTGNSLSLALQTTTPGTPEHERIKAAIAQGTFNVSPAAA